MKYYLIIGYRLFEKYKKNPICTLHVDQNLLFSFDLDTTRQVNLSYTIDEKELLGTDIRKMTREHTKKYTIQTNTNYKMFEIDDEIFTSESKLHIKITNNWSDYNNGFIKRHSTAIIEPVFLIQKDLLENDKAMKKIITKSIEIEHRRYWHTGYPYKRGGARWPGVSGYPRDSLQWKTDPNLYTGGDKDHVIPIVKKHGYHMLMFDEWETHTGYHVVDRYFTAWYQHHTKQNFNVTVLAQVKLNGDLQAVKADIVPTSTINT